MDSENKEIWTFYPKARHKPPQMSQMIANDRARVKMFLTFVNVFHEIVPNNRLKFVPFFVLFFPNPNRRRSKDFEFGIHL